MRESLWAFSCQLYRHNSFKNVLLQLQDDYQLNVNFLLGMIYLAHHDEVADQEWIDYLLEHTESIVDKIVQIRTVRRMFKNDGIVDAWQATYSKLKDAELCAEKVHLQALEKLFERRPPKTSTDDCYLTNIQSYWSAVKSEQPMPEPLLSLIADAPFFAKSCG